MNGTTLLAAGDSPRTYDYYSGFQHENFQFIGDWRLVHHDKRPAIGVSTYRPVDIHTMYLQVDAEYYVL